LNEQDVEGRVFTSDIKMLPTEQEQMKLEGMMNEIIQTNPDFTVYCDSFKVMRMAREDIKMAEKYFRQCQKKMIQGQAAQKQQDSQQNAQMQQQSNQQAAQNEQQLEALKAQYEASKNADLSKGKKEEILLTGFTQMWAAGVAVPPELKSLEAEVIKNVALPIFGENQKNTVALSQGMQDQGSQQQGQQPQLPPPDQQQPQQGQPDQSQQNPQQ